MSKIYGPFVGGRAGLGLLLLRLVFGLGIAIHGWGKVSHSPFHWADKMGIPSFLQGLAALSEFGGGLALIVGLLTPLAMLGLAITMLVAIIHVHLPSGATFISNDPHQSFETPAFYLVVAVAMIVSGPGTLSLDSLLFGRRTGLK